MTLKAGHIEFVEISDCGRIDIDQALQFAAAARLADGDIPGRGATTDCDGQQPAYYDEQQKTGWIMPSPLGLGLLGLGPLPRIPVLSKELKADSNLAIFAGAGLDFEKLISLFRFCKIKRIDQFIEFQVNPKRLREMPSRSSAGEELRAVLNVLEPLPAAFAVVLQDETKLGGKVAIRYCSALVKLETPEALSAVRQHPQLKGYLEAGAPPGYLLVKSTSNPDTFVRRCRALGFEVGLL